MDCNRRTLTLSCLISVLLLGHGQAFAQEVVVGTLVRTTLTSQFSPPSSDPSGVAYDNRNDRLVISDGEIEETTRYQGVNVFETTRSGVLQHTFDTTSFSNEPVGSAFNPSNGHYFFSDDDRDDIYEIDPGPDGMLGGGDDTRTTRNTSTSGNGDPEGLAYGNGTIFVTDGKDNQVYKYALGGGVTSCDTSSYVLDAEGLEFDPNTQTLYIVGKPVNRVFEITTNCALIRAIDISAAAARKPAGLAIAPGSQANNPDTTYIYITERGRDAINDGKVYEFALGGGGGGEPGNLAPIVSAGADQTIDSSASCISDPTAPAPCADLDGEVTDDGLPDPPGAVTTMWSRVSGPGTVTFGDASSVDTTASFSTAGSYVLRLTASDSALSDSDDVTINVQAPPTSFDGTIYVSGTTAGNAGGVAFRDEDIIAFNTNNGTWSLYFDGSDVGLGSPDVDAFDLMADGSILFSLGGDGTNLPGVGVVDDSDIVRFIPTSLGSNTAGTFEPYFDGSDVELTVAAEDVDAIGFLPDGRLVISTFGNVGATGVSGADEDLLAFSASTLGEATSGSFTLYFDGSDVELSQSTSEDVNGTWIDGNGDIYLTTLGAFSVSGVSGDGADIFRCIPGTTGTNTTCSYDLTFDGSANGLAGEIIDGIELAR